MKYQLYQHIQWKAKVGNIFSSSLFLFIHVYNPNFVIPVPTMEDFRREAYLKHPGTQTVYVQRDDFAMGVLGVYKNPVFDLCMKPQVIFAGELGRSIFKAP